MWNSSWNSSNKKRSNRKSVHKSTSADESKSWQGQRPLLSPSSSVTSGISIKSLPAHLPCLSEEERKKINDEAYIAWRKAKAKQENEKKEKAKEEQERIEREKKDKEEKQRKFEAENRSRWMHKKQLSADVAKQKQREEQNKIKQDQEEKQQFSKEMVATWMAVARNRSKPVKGGVFESPRLSYINPLPWIGVMDPKCQSTG